MGISRLFQWIQDQLSHPLRVLWFCAGLACVNLFVEGSLLRLWQLHRDYQKIQSKTEALEKRSLDIEEKLRHASDPLFIEREARDRFDLVGQGDLVFVFSDEEEAEAETDADEIP